MYLCMRLRNNLNDTLLLFQILVVSRLFVFLYLSMISLYHLLSDLIVQVCCTWNYYYVLHHLKMIML